MIDLPFGWELHVFPTPGVVTRRVQPAGYGPRPLQWRRGVAVRAFGWLFIVCRASS